MGKIVLTKLDVSKQRVDYRFEISDDLKKYFDQDLHMFVQYDFDIDTIPKGILVIPFLGNVMQIAWLTDSRVYVDSVDAVFKESLLHLREAYRKMYPHCPLKGDLEVKCIEENSFTQSGRSAQLYTGGLDATTTYIRHQKEKPLLIQEYGFYDAHLFEKDNYSNDEKSERNFISDITAATHFAKIHELQTSFVRSNFGTFIKSSHLDKQYSKLMGDNFWHGLHHAMALLSAAAPICYANRVSTLYIASSFSVGNSYPCASDPTTDNEFCFAGTKVCHDGYEMTDQDKARFVVSFQKQSGLPLPLRTCSWNDHNCCSCEKCLRRILQINAEGGDPRNFGFFYTGTVKDVTSAYLDKEIQFFTTKNINKWGNIIRRMQQNYAEVYDKSSADYLSAYAFEREKKRGLYRYYRRNFFAIIKRKVKGLFIRRV